MSVMMMTIVTMKTTYSKLAKSSNKCLHGKVNITISMEQGIITLSTLFGTWIPR